MHKVYKLRIYPNKSQTKLINRTLDCCRWVSNRYLEEEIRHYTKTGNFLTDYDFEKIINRMKKTDEYSWIAKYNAHAINHAIFDKWKAFKSFFKRHNGFPKFKSKKKQTGGSLYFDKQCIHYTDNKNIIKLPILGKVRITQYNYLPDIDSITSGRIIKEKDKYYVSFITEEPSKRIKHEDYKLGIDIGIGKYASLYFSNDISALVPHFKDLPKVKSILNKITNLQKILSNKVEVNYGKLLHNYFDEYHEIPNDNKKKDLKGESYKTSCIRKLKRKINKLYTKLANIRKDFIYKLVYNIVVRTKPRVITMENLDISEMLQQDTSKTLHKYISMSGFYMFRNHMIHKCMEYNTKLRLANKYFASSKTCSCCGNKKTNLSLSDRTYHCDECGLEIDRDLNAAINLCNLKKNKCTVVVD